MITYKTTRGTYPLNHEDVIYFYAYDDSTFCRFINDTVEVDKRLYEVEEELFRFDFIRISKWNVVNFNMIQSAYRIFNSKFKVKMINGDILYVNRAYIKKFKLFIKEKGVING